MASSLLQLNCRLMPKLDLTKFMYAWDKLCPTGRHPTDAPPLTCYFYECQPAVNFIAASILSRQVRTVEPAPNALALPRAIPRAVSSFSESQLMTEVGCSWECSTAAPPMAHR
jgi:hypothetical protein